MDIRKHNLLVMGLVVLAPLKARMDTVEESRLSWSVAITPIICSGDDRSLVEIAKFFFGFVSPQFFGFAFCFLAVDPFSLKIGSRRSSDTLRGRCGRFDLVLRNERRLGNGMTCGELTGR